MRRGPVAVLILAVAAMTTVAIAVVRSRELSPMEQRLVGRWYGYVEKPDGVRYAWLSERRADRTCTIQFRNYGEVVGIAPVEVGIWRVVGNRMIAHTWRPGAEPTFLDQLTSLIEYRRFVKYGWVEEYEIVTLTDDEYVCTHEGRYTYRSKKVSADFELPDKPTSEIGGASSPDGKAP